MHRLQKNEKGRKTAAEVKKELCYAKCTCVSRLSRVFSSSQSKELSCSILWSVAQNEAQKQAVVTIFPLPCVPCTAKRRRSVWLTCPNVHSSSAFAVA